MIRVFVDPGAVTEGRIVLEGAEAKHLGGALRVRPGETVFAVEEGTEHECVVKSASPSRVELQVVATTPTAREPRVDVRIAQGLPKGDQFERILEFGTELGATSFQPLLTERTVARPEPDKLKARSERWRQVIRGAAALGQRGRLPVLLDATDLSGALAAATEDGLRSYLLYEGTDIPSLSEQPVDGGVCLVVGPEGGWSDGEVAEARRLGAVPVSLGPRIMRPLPAVMAALAVVLHNSGDLTLKEPG